MTREEKLHWLNVEIQTWENECQSKHPIKEALYEARKALEQKPILDKIRTEIENLPTTKCTETRRIYIGTDVFKVNALAIIDKYKAESEADNGNDD